MLRPTKGMMTGYVKGVPTKQAPIVKPEIERAPPKPLPETKESASTPAPAPEPAPAEMTFTFVEGKERGDASPYTLYKQTGKVRQVTADELKAFYNDPKQTNRIPEVFGSFDNYLAYMTEREELLKSGDLTLGDWAEATGGLTFEQEMILAGEDLQVDLNDTLQNPADLARRVTSAQQAGYNNWINSEVNKKLLEKYGVNSTVYSDSGDKFEWNGSAYVKTVNENHAGVGDFVKIGLAIAAGVVTGGAASGALSSALGATGSAAVGAGLGSVVSQGIATGEIDLEKALIAAASAGITNEFSDFLGSYVEGSTQEQIKRLRDIQATVQPGGQAYQAAQQQIDLLTGALESADIVNQGGNVIMNLTGSATEAYNQYRDIQENLDEFTSENEDAAWQTPDTTEILGDVQVQIRDYVSELEEQQQSGESGAQPVEDIFADTTAEETGLEAESTITEEMFSEYFPQPVEGPQGDPGRDGVDGIDGVDGRDGVDGVDGVDGRDGIDGTDGRDGVDGRDGIDGRDADPEAVRGIVESVVNQAISNIPPGMTPQQVSNVVNEAIGNIQIPEGITPDDVQTIVNDAVSSIQIPQGLTTEDVDSIVSSAISSIEFPQGITSEEVQGIVNQAISNIPPGTSTEEVREIVNSAIGGLDIPEEMSADQVREIVSTAIGNIQFPASVTQEQVDEVVGGVRSDLETATTELGTSILGVQREVSEVERSLTEALEAATLGQATDLNDAEARLLSELTGVEADILQQMAESDAGLEAGLFDLGTNINQVRTDLQSQLQTTQQQTEESLEQASDERRDLQLALIAVGGDVNRLDAQTRQQFEEFGENVNQLFAGVNVDIEGLQAGQVSQAEAFAQYQEEAAIQAEEATEDRRNLQQAIIGAQGDIERLDENTRQQFEEFGGTVNELFSDVNVDIEALQEGQISQAEAQQAFQQSTEEQFGEIGGQIGDLGTQIGGLASDVSGIGAGLEGLGQGVAGLGAGLGVGLLGLGQQQQQLAAELARPDPIPFDPFLKGLSPFQMLTPIALAPQKQTDALGELNKFLGRQTGMLV
jgi:hypothetical protein